MEVRFTEQAESCLKEIYGYYSEESSPEKASEILNKIIDRAEALKNHQTVRGLSTQGFLAALGMAYEE